MLNIILHRFRHGPLRIHEIVEPNINSLVVERTDSINEDTLLHDETTEEISEEVKEFFEQNHISELDRRVANMDRREMITVCCVAVRKYPLAYLQVIAEYIIELIRKGRKHERSESI